MSRLDYDRVFVENRIYKNGSEWVPTTAFTIELRAVDSATISAGKKRAAKMQEESEERIVKQRQKLLRQRRKLIIAITNESSNTKQLLLRLGLIEIDILVGDFQKAAETAIELSRQCRGTSLTPNSRS